MLEELGDAIRIQQLGSIGLILQYQIRLALDSGRKIAGFFLPL
jgi:hypothetical protein